LTFPGVLGGTIQVADDGGFAIPIDMFLARLVP
jgi:hypothetical protein